MADAEGPRIRPLVADPRRDAGTDLLEREPLPEADEDALPDAGRASRHGMPDPARLAFQRPPGDRRIGPASAGERARRAASGLRRVPTRQLTTAVVVTLAGVGLLLGWAVHVSWTPFVDVALILLGVVLVAQAGRGPVSRPLVALGVLLAVVAAATWRADVTLDGGLGRRTIAPTTVAPLDRHLGTGQLTLDLTKVPPGIRPYRVHAEVGIGRIVVTVPKGTLVATRAVTGGGATVVFSTDHAGPGIEERSSSGKAGERVIDLDLRVGLGTIEVRRG
ncbi:MAG: hypothetical protein JWM89_792 [Acidimicrobiales bacterium]|nr:hypothetical protein [Acidimicrobiales bacterium]